MAEFKVVSDFDLMGDQPEAVDTLANGILDGKRAQTLMGVTGSGKTFTMAKMIERVQKPTLVISPQQDAGGTASRRVQGVLPGERSGIFCLLLRLLPAGSLRAIHRYVYRERF